jgi:hypothetical protein
MDDLLELVSADQITLPGEDVQDLSVARLIPSMAGVEREDMVA